MMRSGLRFWFAWLLPLAAVPSLAGAMTIQVGDIGQTFVDSGEVWRFFRGVAAPSGPAEAWTAVDFDDSQWETGPAGFGYGDDDDATILDDMRGSYVSLYARKTFTVSAPLGSEMLELTVDYDDGFIAYLNGREVARRSMPEGPATHKTKASSHEAGSPETIVLGTAAELLVQGTNVLAIEGHNISASSSDFSLNATLQTAPDILRAGEAWIATTMLVVLRVEPDAPDAVRIKVGEYEVDLDAAEQIWSGPFGLSVGANEIAAVAFDADGYEVDSGSIEILYVPPENHLAGELSDDTALSGAWVLDETVTVATGAILTIESGTVISMQDDVSLVVYGQLLAQGTAERPIRWTQFGAGTAWNQILFVDANDSRFDHCLFEYADCEGAHQDYYEEGPRDYHEAIVALACHVTRLPRGDRGPGLSR